MGQNTNRRLLFFTGFVLFFAIIVIVWYFFYAKPAVAPSLGKTNSITKTKVLPPRFQFINWSDTTSQTSVTEIVDPLKEPLLKVWDKPATGQTFIAIDILKEVTATSTSGTSTVEIKKIIRATSTALLFVDKTTGYVYGYSTETGKTYQISNTLIPGVHDAYFFSDGNRVIMRYIDQEKKSVVGLIATLPRTIPGSDALPLIGMQYLTSQVMSIAVSPKKDTASYVVATESGSAVYTVADKNPSFITASPFREWDISYGGNSLFVTTKPSAYVEGVTFSLPSFQSELRNKTGLMTLPGDNATFLNSMWAARGLTTFISNQVGIRVLSVQTIASKCSWGRGNLLLCAVPRTLPETTEGLPDDWFQGRVSFSDDFFVVDGATAESYRLYTFPDERGIFDVIGITQTQKNDMVAFTKKQDESLWILNRNLLRGE